MNLKNILKSLIVTVFLLVGSVQASQAVALNVAIHGEPYASDTFVKGVNGEWTFEQDTFSVGIELGHEYNHSYFYAGSRIILNSKENETNIAGTGATIEAGIEAGRIIRIKYKSVVYWDQSGDYGYGQLCYTQPAHRVTIDVRMPILGGKIPWLNESESYSY